MFALPWNFSTYKKRIEHRYLTSQYKIVLEKLVVTQLGHESPCFYGKQRLICVQRSSPPLQTLLI